MGSLQLLVSWMQKRAEKQNNVLVYEEGEVIKLMQSLQTGLIPDSTSPAAAFATFRRLCASFPLSSSHPNPYSLSLLSGQEMVSRMCGELRECLSVPLGEEGAVKALFEMCLKPMAIIPEPTEIRESPTPPKQLPSSSIQSHLLDETFQPERATALSIPSVFEIVDLFPWLDEALLLSEACTKQSDQDCLEILSSVLRRIVNYSKSLFPSLLKLCRILSSRKSRESTIESAKKQIGRAHV